MSGHVLLLLLGGFTVASFVWALTARRVSLETRMRQYASATPYAVAASAPPRRGPSLPRRLEAWLAGAGLETSASEAAGVAAACGAAGLLVGLLFGWPLVGLAVAWGALYAGVHLARARRAARMAAQLADALMLMATALRSGLGFQAAIQMFADEGPQPLAGAFDRFARDMRLGAPLEDALARLQDRLGTVDGEMLTAALLVQRQTGGNLSEILLNLHHTIRDRQAVLGQVKALTAQGRLSGLVLSGIPVFLAVMLYLINPGYMGLLASDPRGRMMAAVGLVLMVIGTLAIRKIAKITL